MTSEIDIFSQISQISEDMAAKAKENQEAKKKSGGNKKFADADMIFLDGVTGTYELKLLVDSDGKFFEDIFMHTVKTKTGNGGTVVCKNPEECKVCQKISILKENKYKDIWRYSRRNSKKILVKIGKLVSGDNKGLVAGKTYIAYIGNDFYKNFVDAINTGQNYYKEDLRKMFDVQKKSGGFLVTASYASKKMSHNIQFIPQIEIDGGDPESIFNAPSFYIKDLGYFRNNYIPEKKLNPILGILDTLIIESGKNKAAANKSSSEKSNETKSETVVEEKVDTPTDTKSDTDNSGLETFDSNSGKQLQDTPTETPNNSVNESKIETVEVEIVHNPEDLGENGKPKCFAHIDLMGEICKGCPERKPCTNEAVMLGNI